jgi:hypothetical protein
MAKYKRQPISYVDDPISWFAELAFAAQDGDFARAATAQQRLDRLGWQVKRRPRRPAAEPVRA